MARQRDDMLPGIFLHLSSTQIPLSLDVLLTFLLIRKASSFLSYLFAPSPGSAK